jgi:hypothetical protein
MPFKGSFLLGPFSVDRHGRLSPASHDISPGFSIQWRRRVVHARLAQRDSQCGHLAIQSRLGRIPSSASDPATRLACFTMLQNLLYALPRAWTMRLLPDHQPQLNWETCVSLPITATNLVTELTIFLLLLSPYLDLMDKAGVEVVTSSDGNVMTSGETSRFSVGHP